MYITGGIGSSGFRERFTTDYDLPNSTNYSETCASIGVMMFGQRMAAITGDASYYDYVEKALYNTVIAGINIAGDRYFYVNPLEVVPEFCTEHTYMEHVKAGKAEMVWSCLLSAKCGKNPCFSWDSTYTQKTRKGFILTSLSPLQQIQKSGRAG